MVADTRENLVCLIDSKTKISSELKAQRAQVNARLDKLNYAIGLLSGAYNLKQSLYKDISVLRSDNWRGTRYSEFDEALRQSGSVRGSAVGYMNAIAELKGRLVADQKALGEQVQSLTAQINAANQAKADAQRMLDHGFNVGG